MHDTGAFAEHLNRAGAGATGAKNVRVQDAKRGAAYVSGADALNESGNIDVSGTGTSARRIKAIQATIGFNNGGLRRKGRLDIAESLAKQQIVR
jgi:hypothetical protein